MKAFGTLLLVGAVALAAGSCYGQTTPLSFRPIDAEYSYALDRIIMVSANPNQLHIYDGNTGSDTVVDLPKAPSSVSISPDGYYAAVGHDQLITYIDLTSASVVRTFIVSMNVADLALATQYVYVLPGTSVHLATGAVSTVNPSYASGPGVWLHPGGKVIYSGSSNWAYMTDVSTGPITTSSILSYYGATPCGPFWFSRDGLRLYTACGTVFRAPGGPGMDLTYRGMLMPEIRWVTDSEALNAVAVIPQHGLYAFSDNEIWLYDSTYMNRRGRYLLPDFTIAGKNHPAHGKWIFYNAGSTALFTVMQADTSSGLQDDFALYRIALADRPPCAPAFAVSTAAAPSDGGLATVTIEAAVDCMYTASSEVPWISVVSGQHGTGKQTLTYLVRANPATTTRTGAIVMAGSRFEIAQDAAPASLPTQVRLAYKVVDAEYSKGLDKLIMVSAGPHELHIFDPRSQADRVVSLPAAPLSVGVRPDGLYAAVGHFGWISIVNLETAALEKIYAAPTVITDIVMTGNGSVYGLGNQSSIEAFILNNELQIGHSLTGQLVRLHPSGDYMYAYDHVSSKWNIRDGIPERVANSRLIESCYGLWLSESGSRFFTGCGKAYRSSEVESEDGRYNGTLSSNLAWADHSSLRESVAVIPGNLANPAAGSSIDQELQIYDDAYLGLAVRLPLTKFDVAGTQHAAHGRFVFWTSDASALIAVTWADTSSKLLSDSGLQIIALSDGTDGCVFRLGAASASAPAAGVSGAVAVSSVNGCLWSSTSSAPWLMIMAGKFGFGSGTVSYNVMPNPTTSPRTAALTIANQTFTVTQAAGELTVTLTPTSAAAPGAGAERTIAVTSSSSSHAWTAVSNDAWISVTSGASATGSGTVRYQVSANPTAVPRTGTLTIAGRIFTVNQQPNPTMVRLRFVPVTPCRLVDTRLPDGPFGGPQIPAQAEREFELPLSECGIPDTAAAYSLNLTVVPTGPLGYVTLWPARQERPLASTLNSHDGRVKANAAIVVAGYGGGVGVYATQATHIVLDISGYFVPDTDTTALAFYPVTPCRVTDTRVPGSLGSPMLSAGTTRQLPVLSSSCNVPATARAYSLNITAVPKTTLSYLTVWPAGQGKPLASTLNAHTGAVTANAAIVPAGTNGAVEMYVTQDSDVVIDINGYFAPPQPNGLSLYAMAPCRVIDTRIPSGAPARLGRFDIPVSATACAPPPTAQAYVFNATAVPQGALGYLTLWPGATAVMPAVSTLNAHDAQVTSNLAIVPTSSGAISAYPSNTSHLVLDLFGYFAP